MDLRALAKRAFPYLIVGAGGFLLAYLLIFLFAFRSDVIPDEGVLPNVVGMSYEDAANTLQNTGFYAQQGQQRISKTVAKGIVLQQDPPGGSRQKRGVDVVLAVSVGRKEAVVPQVNGLSAQEARVAIENAGFTMGRVIELPSDFPRGSVFQTTPSAGERLDLPAEINLSVSAGPPTLQVPDLVGRTIPDARSALEQIGLKIGAISQDTSSIQPENTVIQQNPPAGSTVSNGSRVSIVVSRFPQQKQPPLDTFAGARMIPER